MNWLHLLDKLLSTVHLTFVTCCTSNLSSLINQSSNSMLPLCTPQCNRLHPFWIQASLTCTWDSTHCTQGLIMKVHLVHLPPVTVVLLDEVLNHCKVAQACCHCESTIRLILYVKIKFETTYMDIAKSLKLDSLPSTGLVGGQIFEQADKRYQCCLSTLLQWGQSPYSVQKGQYCWWYAQEHYSTQHFLTFLATGNMPHSSIIQWTRSSLPLVTAALRRFAPVYSEMVY